MRGYDSEMWSFEQFCISIYLLNKRHKNIVDIQKLNGCLCVVKDSEVREKEGIFQLIERLELVHNPSDYLHKLLFNSLNFSLLEEPGQPFKSILGR